MRAGRGSRLENLADDVPKTLVEVMGRPMLDQIVESLAVAGFTKKDIVFICGTSKRSFARGIRSSPSSRTPPGSRTTSSCL